MSKYKLKPVMLLALIIALWTCLLPLSGAKTAGAHAFKSHGSSNPIIHHVDVMIDVGHGGIDGGTSHGSLLEKNINLDIAKKVYDHLRRHGIVTVLDRLDDYALSEENHWLKIRSRHIRDLAQRSHLANELKPRAVISLHVNTAKRASATGPIILHQKKEESKRLSAALQASLNALYGTSHEAKLGKTYYLLNYIKSPAVIVEMGFLSNPQDRERLTDPQKQDQLALSIARGVVRYLDPARSFDEL